MLGRPLVIATFALACRGSRHESPPPEPATNPVVEVRKSGGATKCTQLPFAQTSPVAEASGATWLTIDGKLSLVVVSDSGNDGAYAILDPETGDTREQGKLPLGGGGDDLEGLAIFHGRMVAISSAGWIREYVRVAGGFELHAGPYPLGPIDLPDKKMKRKDTGSSGMVCAERKNNCGRNYEGICLASKPSGPCLGFAASKADGHLYCLVEREGKLEVDGDVSIKLTGKGALADCAIADDGTLLVGSNIFELGRVYRVGNWADPPNANVGQIDGVTIGNAEVIAIQGDIVYRMSDTDGKPSLLAKYRCPRAP